MTRVIDTGGVGGSARAAESGSAVSYAAANPEALQDLLAFAKKWDRLAVVTFAPFYVDYGLDQMDDDETLTLTVAQFRDFTEAARAAIEKAETAR